MKLNVAIFYVIFKLFFSRYCDYDIAVFFFLIHILYINENKICVEINNEYTK